MQVWVVMLYSYLLNLTRLLGGKIFWWIFSGNHHNSTKNISNHLKNLIWVTSIFVLYSFKFLRSKSLHSSWHWIEINKQLDFSISLITLYFRECPKPYSEVTNMAEVSHKMLRELEIKINIFIEYFYKQVIMDHGVSW